ncbi:MAG: MBL fold metallo-hydrolase, partial [Leptospira sp.]|nr:MBL fold metallo-hydrolase [Leptospira sp.]
MHTPGHNLYHITPFIKKTGVYFSGDLIIANLTAIYSEFDGDLDDYRLTLDRLSEEPIRRMLPAHGEEIENPQRQIVLVRKTLDILERGILRRLGETDSDLFTLMEAAIGKKVHSGGHLATALGLIYAIIKKLEKRHLVSIFSRDDGYETFSLAK